MFRANIPDHPKLAEQLSELFKNRLVGQKLSLGILTCLVPPAPQKSHSGSRTVTFQLQPFTGQEFGPPISLRDKNLE